jgi:biofilm protein TabA
LIILKKHQQVWPLTPKHKKAFDYLYNTNLTAMPAGKHKLESAHLFAMVQEYDTKPAEVCTIEVHKTHMDVQYLAQGAEHVGHAIMNERLPTK